MKFGIELEFTAAVAQAGGNKYGSFYDYLQYLASECNIHDWKIEQDASCGNEIVSPILEGEKGLAEALQICHCVEKAKKDLGIKRITGLDCGIHYHFDANGLNHRQIRNVLVITAIAETLFFAMNPRSRFDTNFAAPLNFNLFQCIRARDIIDLRDIWFRSYMGVNAYDDSFRHKTQEYYPNFINNSKKAPQKYDWTRYHGLNFVALFKHGTMEFRYPHGSFDPYTIEMWYRLFKSIMDVSINNNTRTIIRKSNFPFTMNKVKATTMVTLQKHLYGRMGKVLKFLFGIQKGCDRSLIPAEVEMIQFITKRLMKFHHPAIKADNYRKIMSMNKDDDGNKALQILLDNDLAFPHGINLNGGPGFE